MSAAELQGRMACITGGSRGIGLATARHFAARGASLALCARNDERLQDVAAGLRREFGVPVFARAADVRDAASVSAFFDAYAQAHERLHVLVNNAGESSQRDVDGVRWPVDAADGVGQDLPAGRFEAITDAEWQQALEQKLMSQVRVTRAALPWLRRGGDAAIVNITSIKGRQAPARVVTSGVAWAAVINLSKALSIELAPDGIRVNVVSVGGILTEQMEAGRLRWAPERTLEQFLAPRVANVPLARLGTAEEVADAVGFLGSAHAAYVTGQCLAIDGGATRSI